MLMAACTEHPAGVHYAPVDFADLPGWERDDPGTAGIVLEHTCAKLGVHAGWDEACRDRPHDPAGLRAAIENRFRPWRIFDGGKDDGLFTGYYEAVLRAARTRQGRYQTPVYGVPPDLAVADLGLFKPELRGQRITGRVENNRFMPYPGRAAITEAADFKAPVLLWADDPVDVFFLQVQGSGRALLDDGAELRLAYAAQNGRPYTAIGRVLKEQGLLTEDKVTMASIRAWLRDHPGEQDSIMNSNASYVFFQINNGSGPVGAAGLPLTPERSLAVDPKFILLGAPVWIDCGHPEGGQMQRLMIAEDTGGAIKGPIRGDVFWGYGARAEALAGSMQSRGRIYLLLPHGVTPGG